MRLSLLISILIHVLILFGLVYLFQVVPELRLPRTIYSVKILRPLIKSSEPEKKVEVKEAEPEVKKPAPARPKKKKEKKKPEKKVEKQAPEEKPLDVSVEKAQQETTAIAVEGPRFPFSYYLEAIERKVSRNWFSAVSSGKEGLTCIIYFRLGRNGNVVDVRVERGSGNNYFDRAAIRAVRSSAPFPPLPRAFSESYLGIHFTFLQRDN